MDTKLCNDCGEYRAADEFHANKAKTGGLQSYCKICKKKRDRLDYEKGKTTYKKRASANRQKIRDEVAEIKRRAGCLYCSESDPCCLEFHHVNREDKEANISRLMQTAARQQMLKEIEKCDVVCRNCHAKLHAGRVLLKLRVVV